MRFPLDERQLADNEVPFLIRGQNKKGHKTTCTHCKKTGLTDKHTPLSGYWLLHTNPNQIPLEGNETGTITQHCVCPCKSARACVRGGDKAAK